MQSIIQLPTSPACTHPCAYLPDPSLLFPPCIALQAHILLGKADSTIRDACKANGVELQAVKDPNLLQRLINIGAVNPHARVTSLIQLAGVIRIIPHLFPNGEPPVARELKMLSQTSKAPPPRHIGLGMSSQLPTAALMMPPAWATAVVSANTHGGLAGRLGDGELSHSCNWHRTHAPRRWVIQGAMDGYPPQV